MTMRSLVQSAVLFTLVGLPLQARQVRLCTDAARFLSAEIQMAVRTDPDTVNDFRTGRKHSGCRVTAAGLTTSALADEASRFYDQVRQAGWTRTPDPWDAPRESSLRFRKGGSDCLFNLYEGALLFTEAEREVSASRIPTDGQSRYGVFVMCVPAMPAKPRS